MILLIQPSKRRVRQAVSSKLAEPPVQWVYLGVSMRQRECMEEWLGQSALQINSSHILQETAKALSSSYIDYIGGRGVEHDSKAWWFSSLSEKDPVISKAFLHICYVSVATQLAGRHADSGTLLLVVESREVRHVIAEYLREHGVWFVAARESIIQKSIAEVGDWGEMLARKAWNVGRQVYRMFVARALGFSGKVMNGAPGAAAQPVVLLHNWIDARSFDGDGHYRDIYFGSLRKELEQRGVPVAIVASVLYKAPYLRLLIRIKRSGLPVLIPQAVLTLGRILSTSVTHMFKLRRHHVWPRFEGFDVSEILNQVERMDWMNTRIDDVFLISDIVRRWSRHLAVRSFIYTYEGHSWERGYCQAFREQFPRATLIGYQHALVSPMWLSYFISGTEWGKVPFPDRVVVNSQHHFKLLRQNGVPKHVLSCGGALRYSALGDKLVAADSRTVHGPTVRILVTPAIFMTQAAELLRVVLQAFADPNAYRVALKFHPCFPASRVFAAAGVRAMPAHMEVVKDPVPELLCKADVLVYTYSATAVEALAYGIPIVHFASNNEIDLDPLERFNGTRVSTRTVEELRDAVRAVVQVGVEERAAHVRRWREVVDLLLPRPDAATIDLFMPEGLQEEPSEAGHVATNMR